MRPRRSFEDRPRGASTWLRLSVPLAILAMAGSIVAIAREDAIYGKETANWAAQAIGQDIANLVAFPTLLVLAFIAARGSLRAYIGWLGVLTYSTYTYALYVFDIHFGPLFLVWVAVFGLSVFTLVGGLTSLDPIRVRSRFAARAPVKSTGALLVGIGSVFYALWLSEIVPSLFAGTTPEILVESGLPTNPVHVLDLAVFLPTAILAGILLRRSRPWGYVLAPMILVGMVFISLGIVSLMTILWLRELDATPVVATIIALLGAVEAIVVVRFLRAVTPGAMAPDAELSPSAPEERVRSLSMGRSA